MSMLEPVNDDGELHVVTVEPVQVGAVWDIVRNPLKECIEWDYQDVRIEDVYTALRTGAATLHLGMKNKEVSGVMVTQATADPFSGVPVLHIWLVNAPMQAREGMQYVDNLARDMGARRITFTCPTESYVRLAELLGFHVARYECMKEI